MRDTPTIDLPKPPAETESRRNLGSTVFGMAHEVGYARVSKREQNPDAQAAELRAAGCERVFIDHGESSRVADRPQWLACLDYLRPGDTLKVRRLDRLAAGPAPAGMTLELSPIAFAAWGGLFVTMINLLPVGQLDGGHVTYALLRKRAHSISRIASWICVALVYFGPSWILWAILMRVLGRPHPPTLYDHEPVGTARVLVGVLSLVVSGAYAPMMQHIGPEIVERVNRFFGYQAVARLSIRHGEVKRVERAAPPPSLKPVPESLGAGLRTIADPELKAVLEALASGVAANGDVPQIGRID